MGRRARVAVVVGVALVVPLLPFLVAGELPGDRWLEANGDSALAFGLTGAAILAADAALAIPSSLVAAMLPARLGFATGALWTFVGLQLASMIGYGLGRLALARVPLELPTAPTALALFASRPVPVLAEAMACAAGASGAKSSPLILACAAGNAVYALAVAAGVWTLL